MNDDEIITQCGHLIAEMIDQGIIAYYRALVDGKNEEESKAARHAAEKMFMKKLREMHKKWQLEQE